ncbi:gas vesicle protein GvpO [Actinomycetospora cinnamomea]|uniref:Gas vesicle protein GvpO n=1 Tax=Actinomycetospora cinnamomea TaxID=663609 RepID=A0A2U1EZK9_9PSEU|nr:gas vesicle protein GvpO [Actinomycetospora cinnamomea]
MARGLADDLDLEWETLSGLRRGGEGWTVTMDVVETPRVPSTTDVVAVYEVDLDDAGDLLGYRRLRHYVRGRGDNERYG